MLIRIVRMTFRKEEVEHFLRIFNESKLQIRNFEGCTHLELMKDKNHPNVLITYSRWDSEEHLDKYRFSELFKTVWGKTRVLFSEKPVAFSMEEYIKV